MLNILGKLWLISDTHFFHQRIKEYCNRPDNWQDLIINNWNSIIQPTDTVLHLGDFALGKKEQIQELVSTLNGKILLLRGNHDRCSNEFYKNLGIDVIHIPFETQFNNKVFIFSHEPIIKKSVMAPNIFNFHGHIHNNPTKGITQNHINLCVEVNDYKPRKFEELYGYIDNLNPIHDSYKRGKKAKINGHTKSQS
jgi:calcineurin-like phosphoesterase family protein